MNVIRSLLIAAAAAVLAAPPAAAQTAPKLKVGLMLPASGTYAALGTAIENGFKLYVAEQGGKLAGREVCSSAIASMCWSVPCIPAWQWRWPRSPRTPAPR